MSERLKIRVKRPYIGYPGSTLQNTYAEAIDHGYLLWDINNGKSFDVHFHKLNNPKPYVTLPWAGDVEKTIAPAREYPIGTRYRIHSRQALTHHDTVSLTTSLKQQFLATEVTFKTDQQVTNNIISTGDVSLLKEDLRNPDVLLGLVKGFHGNNEDIDADEWIVVAELIKGYLAEISGGEDVVRNIKWSLKQLEFDNTFNYGEGNLINVEQMHGITGIFGANRSGKSSIVGAMLYTLFNTTDRGSVKNLEVINARKSYCSAKALINVNGTDYSIERQTTKHQNKWGNVHATTALNVFRLDDGSAIDMAGEQRSDTEKVLRSLLGSHEDALLTAVSSQGEINHFIQQGQTKRQQILSRFLDLDVIHKIYDQAKNDVNYTKGELRSVPEREWVVLITTNNQRLMEIEQTLDASNAQLHMHNDDLSLLRTKLSEHKDVTPVTKDQVERQRTIVKQEQNQFDEISEKSTSDRIELERSEAKVVAIDALKAEHDIVEINRRFEAFRTLDTSVIALRHAYEKEAQTLRQQQRSLKILDEVPCGDEYPTCKFIKDAHVNKTKVEPQQAVVIKALEKVEKAEQALEVLKKENLEDRKKKIEQLIELKTKLLESVSNKRNDVVRQGLALETLLIKLEASKTKLAELEGALKNEENAEVVALRSKIEQCQAQIHQLDKEKLELASERGTIRADLIKFEAEQHQRNVLLRKMKAYELLSRAFSKRGIPTAILTSQLPFINAEIAKILNGIVDFTIELEADEESDALEVYIDYGDSRRIIEMCCGMEKTIASIAIRVALINVTTLPKSDMFIIDESFGPMDEASIESCNRLLVSLKRYFRCLIVISHVDGIKEAADQVLEITKKEKDAHVYHG